MMRRVGVAAVALFLAAVGGAADAKAQQRYLLEETTIVAGKANEFEAAQREYCAAVVRGGAPECLVLSPTTFSPTGEYLTLLRFGSFSHYDEGTYTSKGLTPAQATELRARREPTTGTNREEAVSLLEEASYRSSDEGALVEVVDVTIQPGTLPRLLDYVRRVELPEARHAGVLSSELYQVVAGGETNRFLLLRRMERFATMGSLAPFGDTVQTEQNAVSLAGCVVASRTTVLRVRKDLEAKR